MTNDHAPVLVDAVVDALAVAPTGTYVDATFGRGGHTRALLARLSIDARVVVIDRDPEAVVLAVLRADEDSRVLVAPGRFSEIDSVVRGRGLENVIGVLMDLGVSSPQLDDPARGFSFRFEAPLDMRMDRDGPTAAEWLDAASEKELEIVFRDYGEERYARRIARAIVRRRQTAAILSTTDLVEVIEGAQPKPDRHKHAATRVFQAVRIKINDELEEIRRGIAAAFELLAPGGRLAVISFHSIEDRIVKRTFTDWVKGPAVPRRLPIRGEVAGVAKWIVRSRRADTEEVAANPRARSALLRVVEKR
jgi:16S rRNA (cytosine1402-N4)-methyltransferase